MNKNITIREIKKSDCQIISEAFQAQGWKDKSAAQYEKYVILQEQGIRDVIIAEFNQEFTGYLTINWTSDYPPFRKSGIPEVVDFNVLKKFQRLGIGAFLMDEAERRIKEVSQYAGIGFGVYKDYAAAQILYIKRGYIPDGNGLIKNYVPIEKGESIIVDDSIAFYFTKKL